MLFRSSLARAFLETGAYLLGSRWKLSDNAAAAFAPAFYKYLLEDRKSVGEAVVLGRRACMKATEADPGDIGWASYVYYGDPRVCFRAS